MGLYFTCFNGYSREWVCILCVLLLTKENRFYSMVYGYCVMGIPMVFIVLHKVQIGQMVKLHSLVGRAHRGWAL